MLCPTVAGRCFAQNQTAPPPSPPAVCSRPTVSWRAGGSRVPPALSSPPHRGPRGSLPTAASFSVGSVASLTGSGVSPRQPAKGGDGGGRSPGKGGVTASTPPLHRKRENQDDPEMLDLLRNQLEQLAMAKEAEVRRGFPFVRRRVLGGAGGGGALHVECCCDWGLADSGGLGSSARSSQRLG